MDRLTATYLHRAITEGGSGNAAIVGDLETGLARLVGARFASCTASGTAALICALRAAGVRAGDRVAVSALGPAMTGLAVTALGAHPVFLDAAGPSSFGISPEAAHRVAADGVAAVVLVPMWGYWDEHPDTLEVLHSRGVPIIVDAAQAPFLRLSDGLCTAADLVCLSLHSRKPFKAGEGGACLTNHRRLAESVLTVRNFGQAASRDGDRPVPTGPFATGCGANFKMNALGAGWCLAQLEATDQLRARFDRLHHAALGAFDVGVDWTEAAQAGEVTEHGRYGIAAICANTPDAGRLAAAVERRGVEVDTRRYQYRPMYAAGFLSRYATDCPAAEELAGRVVACRLEAFTHLIAATAK